VASLLNTNAGFVARQANITERRPTGTMTVDWTNACHETMQFVKEWLTDATDVSQRPEESI
jgi:hypothetical protein